MKTTITINKNTSTLSRTVEVKEETDFNEIIQDMIDSLSSVEDEINKDAAYV